jgi:hypothetical protein
MNKEHVKQFIKMLQNLDGLMVKASAYADQRKFDVNNFVNDRMAPNMMTFANQIQMACDSAKFCVAYMSHTTAPVWENTEKTWPELRARIAKTIDYLKTMVEADYTKFDKAKVAPVWAEGRWLNGDEQFYQMALPNFYFHMTAAYMLLRKAGVELGKGDYIGHLDFKAP